MTNKVSKYDYPSSETGGVKPMSIRGIFEDERLRLSEEFTDEERKLRKQWLADQRLAPDEPRPPSEEWVKLTRNPIRRMLSKPWQLFEQRLIPVVGKPTAGVIRFMVPRTILGIMATYWLWYHLKYNQNDWTSAYGAKVAFPKPVAFPGDKNFPVKRERFEPKDYDQRGFKDRKVFLD